MRGSDAIRDAVLDVEGEAAVWRGTRYQQKIYEEFFEGNKRTNVAVGSVAAIGGPVGLNGRGAVAAETRGRDGVTEAVDVGIGREGTRDLKRNLSLSTATRRETRDGGERTWMYWFSKMNGKAGRAVLLWYSMLSTKPASPRSVAGMTVSTSYGWRDAERVSKMTSPFDLRETHHSKGDAVYSNLRSAESLRAELGASAGRGRIQSGIWNCDSALSKTWTWRRSWVS